jgi:hypothetical protein
MSIQKDQEIVARAKVSLMSLLISLRKRYNSKATGNKVSYGWNGIKDPSLVTTHKNSTRPPSKLPEPPTTRADLELPERFRRDDLIG